MQGWDIGIDGLRSRGSGLSLRFGGLGFTGGFRVWELGFNLMAPPDRGQLARTDASTVGCKGFGGSSLEG